MTRVQAGAAGWEERLLAQFQIEEIVKNGKIDFVPMALWQFFDC